MKNFLIFLLTTLFLNTFIAAEEHEAMELGGSFTMDYLTNVNEIEKGFLQMGTVELSTNINFSKSIIGSFVLLAENDMEAMAIDAAFVSYSKDGNPFSVFAGLHTFNYGLLETHLISDPNIIELVETIAPGVTLIYDFALLSAGAGFTILPDDSINTSYMVILNCDFNLVDVDLVRLSSRLSENIVDLDLALTKHYGKICTDLEVFSEVKTIENLKNSGVSAGLAYEFKENLEMAFRYNGISDDSFKDMINRFAVGLTYNLIDEIFIAFEYANNNGDNEIAFQLGMESSIKLPGFRRKTLTNN